MKIIGVIVAVLVLVALAVVGLGFSQPAEFSIETSTVIAAPAEKIFPLINSPARWPEWSPWTEEKMPGMKTTYSGPAAGVGAKSSWTDPNSQEGSLVFTESDPKTGVRYDLMFGESKSLCAIAMKEVEKGTEVTMSMEGSFPFMGRVMLVFLPIKEGIESDFNEGLAKMKKVVEGA